MDFRVPVLETFLWQKEVYGIISDESLLTPVKGDRYIVDSNATGPMFSLHHNQIAWYDGKQWFFDKPNIGWITILIHSNKASFDMMSFNGFIWEKISNSFNIDSTNFVNIPKYDPSSKSTNAPWTLQNLLNWMDKNFNKNVYDKTLGNLIITPTIEVL